MIVFKVRWMTKPCSLRCAPSRFGERGRAWIEERRALPPRWKKTAGTCAGDSRRKLRLSDIDPQRIDFVMLEDEIAQPARVDRRARQRHFGPQRPRVVLLANMERGFAS